MFDKLHLPGGAKIKLTLAARAVALIALLAAGLGGAAHVAYAAIGATLTVDSNSDADNGGDTFCTLREAIQAAMNNADYHECVNTGDPYGDDYIQFSISGTTIGDRTITLGASLPTINIGTLTINGNNGGNPVIIDGAGAHRVLGLTGGTVTLGNLTVQNGSAANGGGAFVTNSTLIVLRSAFLDNAATGGDGGAINCNVGCQVTIANSTFAGNGASGAGGAVENNTGTLSIYNSTFTANTATSSGGAISTWNGGSGNPTTTIYNSILANSTAPEDCFNYPGAPLSGSNNIIESTAGAPSDCTAVTLSTSDPNLGAVTGSPAYYPLNFTSPALDAGDNTVCAGAPVNGLDQPGLARPQGSVCDMGAAEAPQTSVTFRSLGSQDGWILESSENSSSGGTLNATDTQFNVGDDGANRQYRAILSFNTGPSLPDTAVITSATLKLKKTGLVGASPFSSLGDLAIDVRQGGFSGNSALQLTDFSAAGTKNFSGKINSVPAGMWYSGAVKPGYLHYLSLTSGNQFRLRFYTDDNNNLADNYLKFASGNAITSSRPQLIITYYVP